MDRLTLEFQGTGATYLLAILLAGVSFVLCAWGVRQLIAKRWRLGLVSIAAAAGPGVALPALLIDGSLRFVRGERVSGRRSFLAGGVLAVLIAAGVVFFTAEKSANAFWLALLAIQLTVAITVIYSSVYAYLGPRRQGLLLALRVIAVLVLLLILFKPVLLIPPKLTDSAPILTILVDRSGSMATADEANLPPRYTQALEMLHSQEKRLGRFFKPVWIDFATRPARLRDLSDFRDAQPAGEGTNATDITAAIRAARDSAEAGNQAGVLLISDGINNAAENPVNVAGELGTPVYSLAVGALRRDKNAGKANYELLSVAVPFVAAVNNVTPISALVRISNLPNAGGEVKLYEGESTTPIATEKIWTAANDSAVTVKFNWMPQAQQPGQDKSVAAYTRKLRVQIAPNNLEANNDDNSAEFHVLLTNPKIRVLYIEGTVRPEYKYLRRLLESDPNVQFVGLIRIAENQFWSQGSIGGRKLKSIPSTDEEFNMFDVIILGDLDSSFLSRDRQYKLREFVNNGGGLLMTGGRSSFGPGGYDNTEISQALPVELGPKSIGQETLEFLPMLTAAGETHPIFAGITGYFPGPAGRQPAPGLAMLPKLRGCVRVPRAKPAAAVLALHPSASNAAGPLVVLAVQQFGGGRSGAFTADTTWQWYLPMQAMGDESPYHRFWGQLIRWLAGVDSKNTQACSAAILRLGNSYGRVGGDSITVSAFVQAQAGQPAQNASVICKIQPAQLSTDNSVQTIKLSAGLSPGIYATTFQPEQAGDFIVQLTVSNEAGNQLGQDELPLKIAPQSTEMENLSRNDKLLHEIAQASAGQFAELSALPDLLDQIIAKQQTILGPPPTPTARRLYNFPILFVLFVGLLTCEWVLRRTWQMH